MIMNKYTYVYNDNKTELSIKAENSTEALMKLTDIVKKAYEWNIIRETKYFKNRFGMEHPNVLA